MTPGVTEQPAIESASEFNGFQVRVAHPSAKFGTAFEK